jgi:putative ABC transport system permease protein
MAWRNLWRNKKRTFITAGSIYFAVVFAIIMRSMQIGTYDVMIEGAVKSYSGFIQIQDSLFFEEKSLDDLIYFDEELQSIPDSIPGVISALPRLETFSLASTGNKTKGVILQGIDAELDDEMTGLSRHLTSGNYLNPNQNGILVSSRLATYLGVSVGDTVILLSQGFQGATAADMYPVCGIVKIPSPLLDNKLILMNLHQAQEFANAYDMVSSIALNIEDKNQMDEIVADLQHKLEGSTLRALRWTDMDKALKQQIESDDVSGQFMLAILYMVIFFGILGTIIMMTSERLREFAVMASVGMGRLRMIMMMLVETILMGLLGLLMGTLSALPIILYYLNNPIQLSGEMAEAYEVYGIEPVLAVSNQAIYFLQSVHSLL